jgi:hypothetical protein
LAQAVKAKVAEEKRREREWWNDALEEVLMIEDPTERRQARAELQAEKQRRRDAGEVLPSSDALLHHYLVQVLAAKGWDRRYKPVPDGEASVSGRRWGVTPGSSRTGDGKGRLSCRVPMRVWEQVRRAAYWTSAPHVKKLQEWQLRFGDGLGRADREGGMVGLAIMMRLASGRGPREADLERRQELRSKIVTTGDILRMAASEATK